MLKTKWLIYTVLIGLIPFFIRLIFFLLISKTSYSYILNEVDMITFGLVLNLSNINELENRDNVDKKWKTIKIGFSLFMIVIFATLLGISYLADIDSTKIINTSSLKYCSLFLSFNSLIFSYSIYNRLNSDTQ